MTATAPSETRTIGSACGTSGESLVSLRQACHAAAPEQVLGGGDEAAHEPEEQAHAAH